MAKAKEHILKSEILKLKPHPTPARTPDEIGSETRRKFREHLGSIGYGDRRIGEAIAMADENGFRWSAGKFPPGPEPLPGAVRRQADHYLTWADCRRAGLSGVRRAEDVVVGDLDSL